MGKYEFTEPQNKIIRNVAWRCIVQSILLMLIGVAGYIGTWYILGTLTPLVLMVKIIQGTMFILMGIVFFPPSLNFLKVTTTKGSDIQLLMNGLSRLKLGIMLIVIFILGSIVCDVLLILISMGVI